MGKATRSMTRQSKSQRQQKQHVKRYSQRQNESEITAKEPKEKNLKLIKLSDEQERTNKLKFVYELPQTLKDIKGLLKEYSEEDQLIIIQRIRDYHNPDINPENEDKFTAFIVNLMRYYLKQQNPMKSILNHLKELCSQHGSIFASYLKNKLIKIVESIKLIQENNDSQNGMLEQIIDVQRVFIEILECPDYSKMLEIIEQTCSHLYSNSDKLIKEHAFEIIDIVQNDIKICTFLKKRFNPTITNIILRLSVYVSKHPKNKELIEAFVNLYNNYKALIKDTLSSQLQILEINKRLQGIKLIFPKTFAIDSLDNKPLEYLQLQNKKPKALATFAPLLEEEFLLFKDLKRMKKPVDEKVLKRKMKKNENHALRELRKDTTMIQIQREKEMQYKKDQFRKVVVRAGAIKDEI